LLQRIILLSGPVAAGKSRLARALAARYSYQHVRTRDLILAARPKLRHDRRSLQSAGDRLDRETRGQWIATYLARSGLDVPEATVAIIDSVRKVEQVDAIRKAFGSRVAHVHLTASDEFLRRRFSERLPRPTEFSSYDDVRRNRTERLIGKLADVAEIVVDTSRSSEADVVVRVASHLGLYGAAIEPSVDVIVGGQFGSEGKGNIASYLAPEYGCLVRIGGPNAGHTVYQEPKKYIFHQLPSGTLAAPDASLVIGPGAVISVPALLKEIAENDVTPERLSIDPGAMVISRADVDYEAATLVRSIASTGQGVGKATARRILRGADPDPVELAGAMPLLRPFVRPTIEVLEDQFARGRRVLLEGTQGTGLSIYHGLYPYVTSRDTTVSGCLAEAGISARRVRRIVMVVRTYPIRVQNPPRTSSGPLSQEISWEEMARRSGYSVDELKAAEVGSTTGRLRRVGEFDWRLLRLSATLNGPTDIALTFVDYVSKTNRTARRFEQLNSDAIAMVAEVEAVGSARVSLIAVGPQPSNIIDRRTWR